MNSHFHTYTHTHTHTKRRGSVAGCCSILIKKLMAVLALCLCAQPFSSCGRGLLFAVVQGLSLPWLLLLWSTRSWHMGLWPTGLTAPRHEESSHSRDRACVPHIGRKIPNQWTTREVLLQGFSPLIYLFLILGQLQYYDGFFHASTWINHSYTSVPSTVEIF